MATETRNDAPRRQGASMTDPRPGDMLRVPVSALVPVILFVAALLVYGPIFGFVPSEYSDWALTLGNHPWYQSMSFGDILHEYVRMNGLWYRPSSLYLIPYLLRLDYFQPAGYMAANVGFFVLAASSIALIARRAPFPAMLFTASWILFAPALYLVPYGTAIDSTYILFGIVFIAAELALLRVSGRRERLMLHGVAIIFFLLALTSKETSVLLPFLLVPVLVLAGPEFSVARIVAALRTAAPYIGAALVVFVAYQLAHEPSGTEGQYSTQPALSRASGALSFTTWTFGFRSPLSRYEQWIPPWGTGETIVAILGVLAIALSVGLSWRRLRPWRIGLFVLTFAGMAIAIALVGGIPHHTYPLVAFVGAGTAIAATVANVELRRRSLWLSRGFLTGLALIAVLQVAQANNTYDGVINNGPQTPFLRASTELFYGSLLAPVSAADNPLFVFEDCLGGLHQPLQFYARASDGDVLMTYQFDPAAYIAQFKRAAAQGRSAFVAECTDAGGPWYRLLRWDAASSTLVPA